MTPLKSIALAVLMSCIAGAVTLAQEATPPTSPQIAATAMASSTETSLRGARYCEVLVPAREPRGNRMMLQVYNTQGLNDCPEAAWNAIDARAEARRLGVPVVIKNGPRYLAYDRISAEIDGSQERFGDLEMRVVATLEWPAGTLPQEGPAYSGMTVDRNTEYVYLAGKPVFELTAPDRRIYVMQTYVAASDPGGEFSELGDLGARLTLPEGWSFREVTPDADLHVATSDGEATVIRDDLGNTYQLLTQDDGAPVLAN